jgi:hypothetical protein
MRFPIYFHGSIPMQDIADALAGIGVHLITDSAGRMNADNVPRLIRKDPVNVVQLVKRGGKR